MIRTRFAPAATHHLSIRELQGALFNSLLARARAGKFVIRIDDLDLQRGRAETVHRILDDVRWLDIDWDEGPDIGGECGPYLQSKRREAYEEALEGLAAEGRLYPCFCENAGPAGGEIEGNGEDRAWSDPCSDLGSREVQRRLRSERPHVMRLRLGGRGPIRFRDMIRGWVEVEAGAVGHPVVRESDGHASRLLCDALDDARMKISHLLRCESERGTVAAELAVVDALGEKPPRVGLYPRLVGSDGNLYSRRHGAFTVESFKKLGYLSRTLSNYLVHLGWTRRGLGLKYDIRDLGERFHLAGIRKESVPFQFPDLNALSNEYIREENLDHLADRVLPYLIEGRFLDEEGHDRDLLKRILAALRSNLHCLSEIVKYVDIFFGETVIEPRGREALREEHVTTVLRAVRDRLFPILDLDEARFAAVLTEVTRETGVDAEKLRTPLCVALTGMTEGTDLDRIAPILGSRGCVEKIDRALSEVLPHYA
jgi:glutamyl-tRNA synthetase